MKHRRTNYMNLVLTFGLATVTLFLALFGFELKKNGEPPQAVTDLASPAAAPVAQKPATASVDTTLQEAAGKRFKITKSDLTPQLAATEKDKLEGVLGREMLLAKLTSEALDHRADLVTAARTLVRSRNPRILKLSQTIEGETFASAFIVEDTKACEQTYRQASEATVSLAQVFSDYCVDRNFDYPGGFVEGTPLHLSAHSLEQLSEFEGLDNDLDKLEKVALRGLIIEDFAELYQTTGQLSYAP